MSRIPGRVSAAVQALRDVRRLEQRIADVERELVRLSPQVAALEQRLADIESRLDARPLTVDDADQAEARSLVEEVRAEHARVRARISAATVFEERLRVLEERAGIDSLTGRVEDAETG